MHIHVAIFRWSVSGDNRRLQRALRAISALDEEIDGVQSIMVSENHSEYNEGYTHVVHVVADDSEAIESYREHPKHVAAAEIIEELEEAGVGIDFDEASAREYSS